MRDFGLFVILFVKIVVVGNKYLVIYFGVGNQKGELPTQCGYSCSGKNRRPVRHKTKEETDLLPKNAR